MKSPVGWPSRDFLSHRAGTTPDRTALIDTKSGTQWTYRELNQEVDRLVTGATAFGEGDEPIGLLFEPGLAFVRVLFGAMRTGRTAVPLNPAEQPAVLATGANRVGVNTICHSPKTAALASRLEVGSPLLNLETVLEATPDSPPVEPTPLETTTRALIVFTSGTGGEPKAVQLTHGNLLASATASAFRLGLLPTDRWLGCLPVAHMGGIAPVIRSVLYGTPLVIQPAFDTAETAGALEQYHCTGISLVPTALSRLLDAGWRPPESLRFVLLGGAPATPTLIKRCESAGVPVCPTYGSTEAASQIATARPHEAYTDRRTVGQPLVCTDVTIINEAGEPCDAGEVGEIVVDGPTITPGYLSVEHTESAFGEYGFHTGDLGWLDDNHRLTVTGRLTDRIITGGENVDPAEVERTLREHPAVNDAIVMGLPDEEWGQRVATLVAADRVTAEALIRHCRTNLAKFKQPKTLRVVEELPRTASGTVDRKAARDRLESADERV